MRLKGFTEGKTFASQMPFFARAKDIRDLWNLSTKGNREAIVLYAEATEPKT